MIAGVGIDTIEIDRFKKWRLFSEKQLRRIFSPTEIQYAQSEPSKYAERLAVRFAAKEACYKALSQAISYKQSFLSLCKKVEIVHDYQGRPSIAANWRSLINKPTSEKYDTHVSLSHTKNSATAIVIIEKH